MASLTLESATMGPLFDHLFSPRSVAAGAAVAALAAINDVIGTVFALFHI